MRSMHNGAIDSAGSLSFSDARVLPVSISIRFGAVVGALQ